MDIMRIALTHVAHTTASMYARPPQAGDGVERGPFQPWRTSYTPYNMYTLAKRIGATDAYNLSILYKVYSGGKALRGHSLPYELHSLGEPQVRPLMSFTRCR